MSDIVPPDGSPPPRPKKALNDSGGDAKADVRKKPLVKAAETSVGSKGKVPVAKLRDKEKNLERTPVEKSKEPERRSEAKSDAAPAVAAKSAEKSKALGDSRSASRSDAKTAPRISGKASSAIHRKVDPDADEGDGEVLAKTPRPVDESDDEVDEKDEAKGKDKNKGKDAKKKEKTDEEALGKTPRPADEEDDEEEGKAEEKAEEADEDTDKDADEKAQDEDEAADAPMRGGLPVLPDAAPDEDERFHAMCAWLSAAALILLMVCPLYFAGPLVYWLRYRSRSRFVCFHAKQALWWSMAATVVLIGLGLGLGFLFSGWLGGDFAGLNFFALVPVQVAIILWFAWVGLKALHGVKFKTPVAGNRAEADPQKLL